jgi:NAD(P)-dependent dehydrogenase (short-subunit alcohol dehydrogenase family)
MEGFSGKRVLVTGAGDGLGKGIARRFAREGASVLVAEINVEAGERTVQEIKDAGGTAIFVETDVSSKEAVEASVAVIKSQFGGLDVLVNNAATLSPNILLEHKTDDMLEKVLRTGLWSTWWFMQAAMPLMREQGGGRIINFYSIDAESAAWLHADYNLTKAAIKSLTQSAAVEWGRFNIQVNAIAPTGAGTVFAQLSQDMPGFADMAAGMNPSGRVGDPEEDIAPVVLFLASDWARYVTGETIHVDGGLHLPRYASKPQNLAELEG